jgi:hypothetical protein
MNELAVGMTAPDAILDGGRRLSDFWRTSPTIFLFLRHFG